MTPLVSVIIPCYNAARWVGATIESALAQTWPRCEIIVVDDGSTDDSLAVARSFETRGVRVLTQPNLGAAAARNQALRTARGEFIQYLDADDLLAPDKIALQMTVLLKEPPDILGSGEWARFTDDPAEAKFSAYPNYRDMTGVEFLQIFYEKCAMMQPGAWLASRALIDAAGAWDESLSLNDDGEYFARVMLRARGIRFCPGARVYYRSTIRGSLSGRRDERAMQSLFRATESIVNHLLEIDSSPRTRADVAYAWKWSAFELYPEAPKLSREADRRCQALGGSPRSVPAGPRFQLLARLIGWRMAKRLRKTA